MDLRPWLPTIAAGLIGGLSLGVGLHIAGAEPRTYRVPLAGKVLKPEIADLAAEVATPLFAAGRRLEENKETVSLPPAPPPRLTGVVLGGTRAVALVVDSAKHTSMLHVGETVEGWTITMITGRAIDVARPGAEQHVALEFAGPTIRGDGATPDLPSSGSRMSLDGIAAVASLGLLQANIPRGSPLDPRP